MHQWLVIIHLSVWCQTHLLENSGYKPTQLLTWTSLRKHYTVQSYWSFTTKNLPVSQAISGKTKMDAIGYFSSPDTNIQFWLAKHDHLMILVTVSVVSLVGGLSPQDQGHLRLLHRLSPKDKNNQKWIRYLIYTGQLLSAKT